MGNRAEDKLWSVEGKEEAAQTQTEVWHLLCMHILQRMFRIETSTTVATASRTRVRLRVFATVPTCFVFGGVMIRCFFKLRRYRALWNIELDINSNLCYEADWVAVRGKTEITCFQLAGKQLHMQNRRHFIVQFLASCMKHIQGALSHLLYRLQNSCSNSDQVRYWK
jgi:hypothetical protein